MAALTPFTSYSEEHRDLRTVEERVKVHNFISANAENYEITPLSPEEKELNNEVLSHAESTQTVCKFTHAAFAMLPVLELYKLDPVTGEEVHAESYSVESHLIDYFLANRNTALKRDRDE
jgi:hypothetical protein